MTREQFWKVVDQAKDSSEPEDTIAEALHELKPQELVSYQEHFDTLFDDAYRRDLWGAAYLMEGGCSDDGFIDFRYGLISLGREIYKSALKNPDSLADLSIEREISNELFGYAAQEQYEEMPDEEEMPRKEPPEEAPEPAGEEWDFDDDKENARRLPKLWAKYGPN